MEYNYHIPVMLEPCLDGLNIRPNGVYVDATYGGGGHSKAILERLGDKGKLLAFDQDSDALQNLIVDKRLIFCQANFRYLQNFCLYHGIKKVDGILADLGVSSHQINDGERGFSFRFEDAVPDMRMNRQQKMSALQLLNEFTESELGIIFRNYGELKAPFVAAKALAQYRQSRPIASIADIVNALGNFLKTKTRNKQLAQIFQAIRIEVNQEMETLYDFLYQSADLLKPGGRLVVMAYHSLEDRPVKHLIATGNIEGKRETDAFGVSKTPFKSITKKPIMATDDELALNSRARSAKLRIAEKL